MRSEEMKKGTDYKQFLRGLTVEAKEKYLERICQQGVYFSLYNCIFLD